MSWNGNGVFNRLYSWVTDYGNHINIDPTRVDADTNDIVSGLNNCLTRDGQAKPTANLNINGFKLTGLATGVGTGDSLRWDQLYVAAGDLLGVTSINGGPVSGPRPNFPNASAQVAQRAGLTVNLSTTRAIGQCDNIGMWASAGAVSTGTLTQITSAISGTTGYAARAAGVTLTGAAVLSQSIRMESRDAVKYKNKTVTLQVKVDHDVGVNVNYTLVVNKPTAQDNFTTRTLISTSGVTAVATGTATLLTFTGVALGDVSNGLELEVQAACGAVATKNFNVTEFMVELGSFASLWGGKEFKDELVACQRLLPAFNGGLVLGGAVSTTQNYFIFPFQVATRISPTGMLTNGPSGLSVLSFGSNTSGVPTGITFQSATLYSGLILVTTTAGSPTISSGQGSYLNLLSDYIIFTGGEL